VRKEDARRFVGEVAELVRTFLTGAVVRETVDNFDGVSMARANGQSIGDVDVLSVRSDYREILLLECKDILQGYLRAMSGASSRFLKTLLKHAQERQAWVESNLGLVLTALGCPVQEQDGWTITSKDRSRISGFWFRSSENSRSRS